MLTRYSGCPVVLSSSMSELTASEAPVMAAVALIEMTAMDPMDAAADQEIFPRFRPDTSQCLELLSVPGPVQRQVSFL